MNRNKTLYRLNIRDSIYRHYPSTMPLSLSLTLNLGRVLDRINFNIKSYFSGIILLFSCFILLNIINCSYTKWIGTVVD